MGDHGARPGSGSPNGVKSAGTFSGIDPDKLPGTINSLEHDKNRLQDSATRFKTRFTRYGIDTQPLNRLLAIAHWADGQLPMLRRRQHLAVAADEYTPNTTMVHIADSAITPGGAARSAKDGKTLGARFEQRMRDHDGAVPEDLFAALAAHGRDGDFLNGFYAELGPRRLSQLSNSMSGNPYDDRYRDHPGQLAYDRDVVCRTFGAYTRIAVDGRTVRQKRAFWGAWFDRFDDPGQGFRPDLLMPFVDSGTYGKDFLVALADRVFTTDATHSVTARMPGSDDGDPWHGDHYVQLFDGLRKNPEAAGEFMSLRPDIIDNGLYPLGGNTTAARTTAFVAAVKAATIDLRSADPALSDRNTAWLLATNSAHVADDSSTHPLPEVSLLYSEILAQHWDDLQYAITSPAQDGFWDAKQWDPKKYAAAQNPARDGIEAQPSAWKSFMEESIREPHAAASMSALFEMSNNKLAMEVTKTARSDNNAISFVSYQMGRSANFYSDAFSTTEKQLNDQASAWAEEMTSFRKTLVYTAAGLATANPEAVVGMAKEKGQEVASGLLEDWVTQQVQAPADQAPKELLDGIKGLENAKLETNWRSAMATRAGALVETDFKVIPRVTLHVPGEKKSYPYYTGNPYAPDGGPKYISGPADDFVAAIRRNNNQVEVKKMTPRQQDAYGRWLADPAVSAKLGNDKVYLEIMGQG
jgi:hypothetical protein